MLHSSYSVFKAHNIHKKDYMISILIPFVRFCCHCLYKFLLLLLKFYHN